MFRQLSAARAGAMVLLALWFAAGSNGQSIESVRLDEDLLSASDVQALIDSSISRAALDLVALLDDSDFAERERATQRLTATLARQEVELLLRWDALSLEQRYRLLEVLRTTVINRPRGAIGIQMGQQIGRGRQGTDEVVVGLVVEGMPASDKLKEGDRITHVDGQRVFNNGFLIDYVQLRSPGDRVTLSIRRPRRDEQGMLKFDEQHELITDELEVEITLGNTDQLDNPSMSDEVRRQIQAVERATTTLAPNPPELRFASGHGERWDEPMVDDYPELQMLLSLQRSQFGNADTRMRMSEQLELMLEFQRNQIQQAIDAAPPGSNERAHLEAVLRRFDELVEERFDGR